MCRRGIERRKPSPGCRCSLDQQKATWWASHSRDARRPRVVVDPGMHTSLLRGNREISIASPPVVAGRLTGRLGAIAANEYDGEVGLARGSGEAGEQGGLELWIDPSNAAHRVWSARYRAPAFAGSRQARDVQLPWVHALLRNSTEFNGFVLGRKPIRKRMQVKLREIKERLQAMRHDGIERHGKWLAQVLRGWLAYYAVPMSAPAITALSAPHDRAVAQRPTAPQPTRSTIDVGPDERDCRALSALSSHPAPVAGATVPRHHPRQEPGALAAPAGIRLPPRPGSVQFL